MKIKKKVIISISIIILLLIVISISIVIFFKYEDKDITEEPQIKISEKLLAPKEFKEIAFYDIHFNNIQQEDEELEITVKNVSKETQKDKWVSITFMNNEGEIIARTPVKIYEMDPMGTQSVYISSTEDLKTAEDFKIEEREAPPEISPEEF